LTVRIHQKPLDELREMLAASPAVRAFLRTSNNTADNRRAIFEITANEARVPVVSLTPGAAGAVSFVVNGNHSRVFIPGAHCRLCDHPEYVDLLTISAVDYDNGDNETTVEVLEAVTSATDTALPKVKPQEPPRIIIRSDNPFAVKHSQSCGDFYLETSGLVIVFEWEPDSTYYNDAVFLDDPQGAGREFGRLLDDVLCDLQRMAAASSGRASGTTWLDIGRLEITAGPDELARPCDNDGRPLWGAVVTCQLGGG